MGHEPRAVGRECGSFQSKAFHVAALRRATHALPLPAAALAGCSQPPHSDLFPLEPGREWTYRVTTDYEDSTRSEETLILRTLPRDTLAAQEGLELGSAWHHRSDSGVDYWLRNDATGIYRVASKSDVQAEPSPRQNPTLRARRALHGRHAVAAQTPTCAAC